MNAYRQTNSTSTTTSPSKTAHSQRGAVCRLIGTWRWAGLADPVPLRRIETERSLVWMANAACGGLLGAAAAGGSV